MRESFHNRKGFTLIELMLVVSIIGVLTVVAIPKMGQMVRKSKEALTKGNLAGIRSALSIYYADTQIFPFDENDTLDSLTAGQKYIKAIPPADIFPYHPKTNSVHTCTEPLDSGNDGYAGWVYGFTPEGYGTIFVSCWHRTTSGKRWVTY